MNFENIDTQRELLETEKKPIEVITPPKEEKKEEKKILTPAEKEEAKKKRTNRPLAQKCKSAKQLSKYAWAFKWRIIFGTFFVLASLGSDILMPKLKGDVIDKLTEDQYADINTLFLYMVLFVVVSSSKTS